MKLGQHRKRLLGSIVAALCLVVNPVFLIPFIAGASFSYLHPEKLSIPRKAFAESEKSYSSAAAKRKANEALAAEEKKKKKKELPSSGTLSQTRTAGTSGSFVPAPWGDDVLSDEAPPIGGSVSRVGARDWVMKVVNNTKDTYTVSLELVQLGRGSKPLKSDYYSYTLKPEAKVERKFSTNQNVADCALKLTKWKNVSKKKPAESGKTPAAVVTRPKLNVEPLEEQPAESN